MFVQDVQQPDELKTFTCQLGACLLLTQQALCYGVTDDGPGLKQADSVVLGKPRQGS